MSTNALEPSKEVSVVQTNSRCVVVVPCYNEAARLAPQEFERFLGESPETDFVFVNDGSTDDTRAVLDDLSARWPDRIQALHLRQNSGKAEAVRVGMLTGMQSAGVEYAGFWDADLATPLAAIPVFAATLERLSGIDIVVGARVQLLGRRIERKASRHYLGRVFATGASLVLALPVYDTQCGAKLFRVNERTTKLFQQPFGSRWIFDVEILARYLKRESDGVYELPVDRWQDVGDSKVKPTDFVRAAGELVKIYRKYRLPARYHTLFDVLTAPFVRYTGAGGIGTVCHFLVLTLSVEFLALKPSIGTVVGALAGASVNYWLNYHLTFSSNQQHRQTLPRFLAVAALGVGLSAITMELVAVEAGQHYLVGQIVATLVVLIVGFGLNKLWTFGKHSRK